MQEKSAYPTCSEPPSRSWQRRRSTLRGAPALRSQLAARVAAEPGTSLASPRRRSAVTAPMLGVAVTPRERRGQAARRTNTRVEVDEGIGELAGGRERG